jgi:hypothetical protein
MSAIYVMQFMYQSHLRIGHSQEENSFGKVFFYEI